MLTKGAYFDEEWGIVDPAPLLHNNTAKNPPYV